MSKIYNPETGRMVLITGVKGKDLIKRGVNLQYKPNTPQDVNRMSKQMTAKMFDKIRKKEEMQYVKNSDKLSKQMTAKMFDKIRKKDEKQYAKNSDKLSKQMTDRIFYKIRKAETKQYPTNSDRLSKKMAATIFDKIRKEDGKRCTLQKNEGMLLTEDLGKIFEKSICMLYNIPYVGPYKYGNERPMLLKERIKSLVDIFPMLTHTAAKGALHDFTSTNLTLHLSAKTSKKKDGKVAPQKIGQPTKKKFLEYFGLPPDMTDNDIKIFIQRDIVRILNEYFKYTFDDKIIYYNEAKDVAMFVEKVKNVVFDPKLIEFGCIRKDKEWNESNVLFYNNVRIGEFQIHRNRSCIKFRWFFENMLTLFPDNFKIQIL